MLLLHAICWYTSLSAKSGICIGYKVLWYKLEVGRKYCQGLECMYSISFTFKLVPENCVSYMLQSAEKLPISKFGIAKAAIPSMMNYWCCSVLIKQACISSCWKNLSYLIKGVIIDTYIAFTREFQLSCVRRK